MMTLFQVLFTHHGENAPTAYSPTALWEGQVNLAEVKSACVSYDNDMLVSVNRYRVMTVALPAWLTLAEWLRNPTRWSFAWGFGVDPTWSESWQRGLSLMAAAQRLACVKLLSTTKFRSEMRASFRSQLVAWLDTAPEDRKFDSPFSRKQWDCLVNRFVAREAQQLDASIYSSHRCREDLGVPPPAPEAAAQPA